MCNGCGHFNNRKNPDFFLKLVGEMSEGGQKRETGYEINRCGECTARIAPLVDNVVLSI